MFWQLLICSSPAPDLLQSTNHRHKEPLGAPRPHLLLREGLLAVLPQPSCGCGPPEPLSCAVPTQTLISQSRAVVLLKHDFTLHKPMLIFLTFISPESLSIDGLQEEELHELEMHCLSWLLLLIAFPAGWSSISLSRGSRDLPSSPWWLTHTKQPHSLTCWLFHHLQVNPIWPHKHKYTQLLSKVPKLLVFHHSLPLFFPRLSWQGHCVPFLWFHTTAVIHPSAETLHFQNLS